MRITDDGYDGKMNCTRRLSGMNVDPLGRDNNSGPGRGSDTSLNLREAL